MDLGWPLDGLWEFICKAMFLILASLFKILDFFVQGLNALAGLGNVDVQGQGEQNLTTYLFSYPVVRNAFLLIMGVGLVLMTLFTIIAIIKSNYQPNRNWKTVLAKSAQGSFAVILIPLCMILGLLLTSAVAGSIQMAISGGEAPQSLGGVLLKSMVLLVTGSDRLAEVSREFDGYQTPTLTGMDYYNIDQVGGSLDNIGLNFTDLNYVIYFLAVIVLGISLALSSLHLVKRIFNLMLLYVISPLVGSTYPLDEGERFKQWVSVVVAQLLSAMGILIVMNLFTMFIPVFFGITLPGQNWFFNGIFQLFLILAGGFAVLGGTQIIAQLTGGDQGDMNKGSNLVKQFMMGKGIAALAKGAVGAGKGAWKIGKNTVRKTHRGLALLSGGQRNWDRVKHDQELRDKGIKPPKSRRASADELIKSKAHLENLEQEKLKAMHEAEASGDYEKAENFKNEAVEARLQADAITEKEIKKATKKEGRQAKKDAHASATTGIYGAMNYYNRAFIDRWKQYKEDVKRGGLNFASKFKDERDNYEIYGKGRGGKGHISDAQVEAMRKEASSRGYTSGDSIKNMQKDDFKEADSNIKSDSGDKE